MEDTYTSRREEAVRFLSALHGDAVTDGAYVLTMLPGADSLWLPPGTGVADVAHEAVQASLEPGMNIYGSCCLLDPGGAAKGGRGDANDVSVIAGTWADLDIAGPTHKSATYPPDRDAALALLDRLELPPTLVVSSGWGLYPWWLLDRPYRLRDEGARTRGRRLVDAAQGAVAHHAASSGWTVDVTSDLARILRIPGTTNWKMADDPRPVRILDDRWTGRRYSPEELSSTWGRHADWRGRHNGQAPRQGADQYVPTGQRTYHVTSLAGVLRNWDAPEDVARVAALEFNRTRCDPPLTDDKVTETVAGIYRRYQAGIRDPLAFLREQSSGPVDWPAPVPLTGPEHGPALNVDLLPPVIRDHVVELARETQTPPDMATFFDLGVIGAAVAKKVRVRIRGGWSEPPTVYCCVVACVGERKTAVHEAATAPLETLEVERVDAWATEKQVMEERRAELLAEKRRADADAVVIPAEPRLMAADITMEALAPLLRDNGGRMALITDEGASIFEILAGRYNDRPSIELFLKGHDGTGTARIDRVGRSVVIRRPLLTCVLAVQPNVLTSITPTMLGRGAPARFLYAVTASAKGRRDLDPTPMNAAVAEAWSELVLRLGHLPVPPVETAVDLSDDAYGEFHDLRVWHEKESGPGGRLTLVDDWATKLPGAVARLALIFHLAEHPPAGLASIALISGETMRRAVGMAEYLVAHAEVAYGCFEMNPNVRLARRVVAWIRRKGPERFHRRDLCMGLRKPVDEVIPALEVLIEHCLVRPVIEGDRRPRSLRDVMEYAVSPRLGELDVDSLLGDENHSTRSTNSTDWPSDHDEVEEVEHVEPLRGPSDDRDVEDVEDVEGIPASRRSS